MKKHDLVAGHLVEGQKITLVYRGEFGGVAAIPTTYLGCRPAPHYQNCPADMVGVAILHKPKGKRKAGYKIIAYNIPLVVYDGWQDIDVDSLVYKPLDDHLQESRYAMHDNRYFSDLLAARPDGVIFADIGERSDG
jgi:hypothetical protein